MTVRPLEVSLVGGGIAQFVRRRPPRLEVVLTGGGDMYPDLESHFFKRVIMEEIQQPSTGAVVNLFMLDATELGDTEIRYFTNTTLKDGSPVMHDGHLYVPVDVEADGFEVNGQGALPTPTIRVANVNKVFTSLADQFDDLIGAIVTRMKTFADCLDGGEDEDPTALLSKDLFFIEQKTKQNNVVMEFRLSSVLDLQGKQIPGRLVMREPCQWRYRYYDRNTGRMVYSEVRPCPYRGDSFFTAKGVPCSQQDDVCGLTPVDCELRFGPGAPLPYGAFPGVGLLRG